MTARIIRTGADHINPPAPETPWQRERKRGPLLPIDPANDIHGFNVPPWCWGAVPLGIVLALHFTGVIA